jgi:hypothetical protein
MSPSPSRMRRCTQVYLLLWAFAAAWAAPFALTCLIKQIPVLDCVNTPAVPVVLIGSIVFFMRPAAVAMFIGQDLFEGALESP